MPRILELSQLIKWHDTSGVLKKKKKEKEKNVTHIHFRNWTRSYTHFLLSKLSVSSPTLVWMTKQKVQSFFLWR